MKEIKSLEIILSGRKITINIVKRAGFFFKFKGLMFIRRKKAKAILFDNCPGMGIHSFFVGFDFLTIWLDDTNKVLDFEFVRPFRPYVKSGVKFDKILEIPVNDDYQRIIDIFKGSKRFKY